ncbi:hypothetical protein M426DRAFT_17086 [Hypoxylon sp. CI-4A]|nr:hypothetical protein M426DRAFT_17086 [Hypoxylon sp. CI-4A]
MVQTRCGPRSPNITCLSHDNHDNNIKDHLVHYFGCIEISERSDFFTDHNSIWAREVEHQKTYFGRNSDEARDIVEKKKKSWKSDCRNELRRIGFLRKTLSTDKDDSHLVDKVCESAVAWRHSPYFREGRRNYRPTRRQRTEFSPLPDDDINIGEYDPAKDVNIPIIQFKDGKPDNIDDTRVWNTFPNQKMTLSDLLKEDSPLRPDKNNVNGLVRYFHIPSNNMDWVERAIGRYFGEDAPNYGETYRELERKKKTHAFMILRDPYWRSQMHGSQLHHPPHARHMRPLCETISSDPVNVDYFPKNMVLFMPYLHWDVSRRSEQMTMEIIDIMEQNKQDVKDRNEGVRWRRNKLKAKILSMSQLLKAMKLTKPQLDVDEKGRAKVAHPLGQYILDAARLYEGMTSYRDKRLLREYLYADRPLHPRRTLDQAYHWTLNSTRKRDRDQVVYRHTTTKPEDFHRYDQKAKWRDDHGDMEGQCEECKTNIQRLSRVIMVDQLWMWILDKHTIITCFPKRYGTNKQDTSAIHKSIRVHLQDKTDSPNPIRTVFDLALLIIDECSNTFFDRTQTGDRLPLVLDAFSKAIGNVSYKQTAAFDKLWGWTDDASTIYRSNGHGDTSGLNVPLLDINPEGRLEREIKDIIEELDIMIHIMKTHKTVLDSFITNAESILDPFGTFGDSKKRALISSYLWDKSPVKPKDLAALRDSTCNWTINKSDLKEEKDDYIWFKVNADERLESVVKRIGELEERRVSAENTAKDVKDLLELKQQQASVLQAWQAVKQSEETMKQGHSIMGFTIVTIIFLPLSFMSSIFGMNNAEITSETWSIKKQFIYMFTISAGVIFLTLFFAFGKWIRAGVFYVWNRVVTAILVKSGIYGLWLGLDWSSATLNQRANAFSDRLKHKAKRVHLERKRRRREQEEERRKRRYMEPSLGTMGNGYATGGMAGQRDSSPQRGGFTAMFRRQRRSQRLGEP